MSLNTCICVYLYRDVCVCVCVCLCTYTYVIYNICVCIYIVCIYTYIYICRYSIHIYTHHRVLTNLPQTRRRRPPPAIRIRARKPGATPRGPRRCLRARRRRGCRGGGRRRSMREGVSRVWRHVVIIFLCGRWPRGSCWRRPRTAGQIMVRRPVARASHVRSTSAIRRHVSTRSALQPLSSLRQVRTWRRGRHGHAAGVAGDEARIERRQRFPPLLAQVLRHGPRTGRWRGNVRPVAYACCELAAVRVVHHHLHHHLDLGRVTARLCCGIIRRRVRVVSMSACLVRCRVTVTACLGRPPGGGDHDAEHMDARVVNLGEGVEMSRTRSQCTHSTSLDRG